MEHEYRKVQIDNFFENLKNKAAEDKQKEEIKEKLKSPVKVKMPERCDSPVVNDLEDSMNLIPFKEFAEKLEQ